MAVPESLTIGNLTGKFTLNKELTDMKYEVLKIAGISWLVRKALELGQLHLHIKHYTDPEGIEHVDITQSLYGAFSIASVTENWILDEEMKKHHDHIFGYVVGKARRNLHPHDELSDICTNVEWTKDSMDTGLVYGHVASDTPKNKIEWNVEQTWGMAIINGERRFARKAKFTGPGNEVFTARLIYNYIGPLD